MRTSGDPRVLAPSIREALRSVNPEAAASFRTMDEVMAAATSRQRFQMQVLAAFAALALLLAATGLYGVLAYAVANSRGEIGVRLALGAAPTRIFRMVASRAVALTAAGAALGSIGWMTDAVGHAERRLRRQPQRSGHPVAGRRGDVRHGRGCVLVPGPPGDAGRSGCGASGGVARLRRPSHLAGGDAAPARRQNVRNRDFSGAGSSTS